MSLLLRRSGGLQRRQVLAPAILAVQVRGKKTQKKAKTKKDAKREEMKEQLRQQELKYVAEEAAMRAARHGEPLDAEMLNPARRRAAAAAEISPGESERRFLLAKEYTRYRMERHKKELSVLQGMVVARQKALTELKKISFSLYLQSLELSQDLFPFTHAGPTATPPIPGYTPPDLEE